MTTPSRSSNDPPRGSAWRLTRTALPLGLFYGTEVLLGITDLAVVGALGADELAAVGFAKTVVLSYVTVGFAILSAALVFMAEGSSSDRRSEVLRASVVIAILMGLAGLALDPLAIAVLSEAGYDPRLVASYGDYSSILVWGIAPALIYASLKNVLNAVERTRMLAAVSVGAVVVNLAASIVLVHGVFGFDGLGVAGAAMATVVVNAGAGAILWMHCERRGFIGGRPRTTPYRDVLRWVRGIAGLGWAAGAQQGLESALFVVALFLLGTFSEAWLAAGSLAFAVMEINYVIGSSYGEAAAARIATLAHSGDWLAVRRVVRTAVLICFVAALTFAIVVFAFSERITGSFMSASAENSLRAFSAEVIRWTTICFVFDALQVLFIHILRGLKRPLVAMLVSTMSYWGIGIAGGVGLAHVLDLGGLGIWLGFCTGLVAATAVLASMIASSLIWRGGPD